MSSRQIYEYTIYDTEHLEEFYSCEAYATPVHFAAFYQVMQLRERDKAPPYVGYISSFISSWPDAKGSHDHLCYKKSGVKFSHQSSQQEKSSTQMCGSDLSPSCPGQWIMLFIQRTGEDNFPWRLRPIPSP